MGIAALIIGLLSVILSVVLGPFPGIGLIALVPAVAGLILGIVDIAAKKKKGLSIGIGVAGLVLSAVAILIVWTLVVAGTIASFLYENNMMLQDFKNITSTLE